MSVSVSWHPELENILLMRLDGSVTMDEVLDVTIQEGEIIKAASQMVHTIIDVQTVHGVPKNFLSAIPRITAMPASNHPNSGDKLIVGATGLAETFLNIFSKVGRKLYMFKTMGEAIAMLSNLKIRNPSSWTMFVFGVLAFLLGFLGLINPDFTLLQLGFEVVDNTQRASYDYTLVFITAASMASFNIGVYYVLAALNNLKQFYMWTVPFRMVTFLVFTGSVLTGLAPTRFITVAIWELAGAFATGIALYYEKQKGSLHS
jgi:hypothetical protein